MYIPPYFEQNDTEKTIAFMQKHAFATLISTQNDVPLVSHVPVLVDAGQPLKILGHLAYANPQCSHIQVNSRVMLIFQGPHAYVSPSWYKNPGVPTWNYTAVHVVGKARIFNSAAETGNVVDRLTRLHEQNSDSPWQPDYPEKMLTAIAGFEIEVDDIQAKFKLSQNRPEEDIEGVIEQLERSGHPHDTELAALMRR